MTEPTTFAVELSVHALERWHERVKPHLDASRAHDELERAVRFAEIRDQPPPWADAIDHRGYDRVAMIGEGICLPLLRRHDGGYIAVTCIVPGDTAPVVVARRERKRRRRRARNDERRRRRLRQQRGRPHDSAAA